ncbi:MAG TPA: hypothetical protein VFE05_21570 [Longimicrobiaceae bacterium]|jgi:hypothetical protein|nr:hypothetical protein [Longimicrobiaceae bacterium]
MIGIGRVTSVVACFGTAIMLLLLNSHFRDAFRAHPELLGTFNVLMFLTAVSIFVTWSLALLHWGRHYDRPRKSSWGVGIFFFGFLGATAYWWSAARRGVLTG